MQPFTVVRGVAAAIPLPNINTDLIAPKALLRKVTREGMGEKLFGPLRYDVDGAERPDFILNRAPFRSARILVALENFGCGSSREHAAWALLDFGVRVVIAPSFAEIFTNNCFKTGVLPLVLGDAEVERVIAYAGTGQEVCVDLARQTVALGGGDPIPFEIDPERKAALLEGRDDIKNTLEHAEAISAFEAGMFDETPWLRRAAGRG